MSNEELTKLIISCYDWWEIEDDSYNETLKVLNTNNTKDLRTMINYFNENIEWGFQVEKSTKILNELNKRSKQ